MSKKMIYNSNWQSKKDKAISKRDKVSFFPQKIHKNGDLVYVVKG